MSLFGWLYCGPDSTNRPTFGAAADLLAPMGLHPTVVAAVQALAPGDACEIVTDDAYRDVYRVWRGEVCSRVVFSVPLSLNT